MTFDEVIFGLIWYVSWFRWVKKELPRNSSMIQLWDFLHENDEKRKDADMLYKLKMAKSQGSHFQRQIKKTHKITPEQRYTIEYIGDGSYKVTRPLQIDSGDFVKSYILSRNNTSVCIGKSCECFCKQCGDEGLCLHSYTCTCMMYTITFTLFWFIQGVPSKGLKHFFVKSRWRR